jgi:predicted GNAT family acetyltransferase
MKFILCNGIIWLNWVAGRGEKMQIREYQDPELLLERVEEFLLRSESVNNLALGILYSLIKRDKKERHSKNHFFGLIESNQEVILVLVRTAHNLVLSGEGNGINEAINEAVIYLSKAGHSIPGVVGTNEVATTFAEAWKKKHSSPISVSMRQRIYRLDTVNNLTLSSGKLRVANLNDIDLISKWVYDFSEEALDPISKEQVKELVEQGINDSSIFLWEDQQAIVSMAKKTRPTRNGVVINLVYSPPLYRGQGYATSCVASLSQKLLDDGYKFCSLYTDLDNPTSNKIYMRIGYKPMKDSIVYSFGE